jgi:hypothetical protein
MSGCLPIKPIRGGIFNRNSGLARARSRCNATSSVDTVNLLEPDTSPSIVKLQPRHSTGASRAYIRICRSRDFSHELAEQFPAPSREIKGRDTSGVEVVLSNNRGRVPSRHTAVQKLLDTGESQVDGFCCEAGEVRGGGFPLCEGGDFKDVCDGTYGSWGAGAIRTGVVLDAAAESDEFEMETSARVWELSAAAGGWEAWSVPYNQFAHRHRRGNGELRGGEESNGGIREEAGD